MRKNDDWIDEILANLGLSDKADANMRALSGGMKRRVLVAQALVHRPPVIMLDEPTAGVDVDLRRTLWEFISRLNKEGHTILLTTHYLEEAEALCGRIAMLKGGRIVALDTTQALLARVGGTDLEDAFVRIMHDADFLGVRHELFSFAGAAHRHGFGLSHAAAQRTARFWKVGFQTIAAPVVTALLYLLIFAHVLEGRVQVYGSVPYTSFLIPGLMMMSMLQNAFANPSSSLIQSRITGNLVFILLPPLSHREIFGAYMLAAVARGLCVGACVWLVALFFIALPVANILWVLAFGVLSCGIMGTLGLIAGLWCEKFDHLAAFQNFLIMPATFLSGRVLFRT